MSNTDGDRRIRARALAVTVALVAIIVSYLSMHTQSQWIANAQPPKRPATAFTDRDREEANQLCLKYQADGCVMEAQ